MTLSKNKMLPLAASLVAAIGLAACSEKPAEAVAEEPMAPTAQPTQTADTAMSNDTVTIQTATGKQTLPANPHPLAVYDMTAMQNLAVLGVPVEGMPTNLRLTNLKAANTPEAAEVGTLFEPDLEALNALQPKAVFVGSRMAEKAEEIAKVAPVVNLTIDTKNVYESTKQQLTDFGQLFGKQAKHRQPSVRLMLRSLKLRRQSLVRVTVLPFW